MTIEGPFFAILIAAYVIILLIAASRGHRHA